MEKETTAATEAMEEVIRRHSLETRGGYAALTVARAEALLAATPSI